MEKTGYIGKNSRGFLVLFVAICILVLLPLVAASSKPVAGLIEFTGDIEQLPVLVYVQLSKAPPENYTCVISPGVTSGEDGSFATNLQNLVVNGFPDASCSSRWTQGDEVWYGVTYGDDEIFSSQTTISQGTGLQWLPTITIDNSAPPAESPSSPAPEGGSAGGGSGGGGSGSSSDETKSDSGSSALNKVIGDPFGSSSLSFDVILEINQEEIHQEKDSVLANVVVKTNAAQILDMKMDLVLIALPNQNIVQRYPDSFILNTRAERLFSIDASELEAGNYMLQAYLYHEDSLRGVSNKEKFFTQGNALAVPSPVENIFGKALALPSKVNDKSFWMVFYAFLFLLLLVALFVFAYREWRRGNPEQSVRGKEDLEDEGTLEDQSITTSQVSVSTVRGKFPPR